MIPSSSIDVRFCMMAVSLLALGLGGCASSGRAERTPVAVAEKTAEQNKQAVREMVRVVWTNRDLAGLKTYWSDDCVNHADSAAINVGQGPLLAYHQGFLTGFLPAFSNQRIEFERQVAEGDLVVSQMKFHGRQTGEIFGIQPTGRDVALSSIRIDRFKDGRICEHWSVADVAGFKQQLAL